MEQASPNINQYQITLFNEQEDKIEQFDEYMNILGGIVVQDNDQPIKPKKVKQPRLIKQNKNEKKRIKDKIFLKSLDANERFEFVTKRKQDRYDGIDRQIQAKELGVKIVIDCSFDKYMKEGEIKSLVLQIAHCMHLMRRYCDPYISVQICGINDKSLEAFKKMNYHKWQCYKFQEDFLELSDIYPQNKIIYLSPDADDILEQYDTDTIYVIGGIIDTQIIKNLTKSKAINNQLKCMRLPDDVVKNFIRAQRRYILNVNDVVELLATKICKTYIPSYQSVYKGVKQINANLNLDK